MRFSRASLPLVALMLACSSDDPVTTDAGGIVDSSTDATALDAGDATTTVGDTITGKVLHFDSNTPAKNVAVTLVDSTGTVKTTKSTVDGSFSVAQVVAPYSVNLVDPDEYRNLSWAWDELTAKQVVLGVEDLSAFGWANHTVQVTCPIQVPGCIGIDCGLQVIAGSKATSVDAQLGGTYGNTFTNAGTINASFSVYWSGTSGSRSTTIEALAWNVPSFSYWYASQVVTVTDGQVPTCAAMALAPVTAPSTMLATITSTNLGSNFKKDSYFEFAMPSGASFTSRRWNTDSFAAGLPSIGMDSWRVVASANSPDALAFGTSASMPTSSTTASAALFGPPVPTTPAALGSIPSTGKIAWLEGSGPALYRLMLARLSDAGASLTELYTPSTSVPLDRLKKLGINVDPGSFNYILVGYRPFKGMDAVVAGPNAPKRYTYDSGSRVDVSFSVTP